MSLQLRKRRVGLLCLKLRYALYVARVEAGEAEPSLSGRHGDKQREGSTAGRAQEGAEGWVVGYRHGKMQGDDDVRWCAG